MKRVVDIVYGGDAGSEGKGKFAGYLALQKGYKHAISNFFPNAGHTWVGNDGEKVRTRYLPSSLVNPETQLYLGPGSAIKLDILQKEIESLEKRYKIRQRLSIHPRAVIVTQEHVQMEEQLGLGKRIRSTLQGGSGALAQKALRKHGLLLAKDVLPLQRYIRSTEEILHTAISRSESILIEGAQGFELDINYGYEYPYTTSRQTTPSQLLADCGLPFSAVNETYCVIRTYPIRVGGPSGPMAGDEITFKMIQERCGAPEVVDFASKEMTSVTNKQRRVFEQSIDRLKFMVKLTQPDNICLNFIQYINYDDLNKQNCDDLSEYSRKYIENLQNELGVHIRYVGTGEQNKHIVVRERSK